jgi:hypothetical protein
MSGTPNPSLNIRELNGNLIVSTNTGEGTLLGIGIASAGPRNVPVPASQLSTVNGFGVGPLVSSIGAHIDNTNRRAYLFQVDYDTAGTFGAVVKYPFTSPQSPSVLSLSAANFSARTDGLALPFGSGALNISAGFLDPPSPLPLTIVTAGGSAAQIITISYYDDAGVARTTTVNAPVPGTYTTGTTVRLSSIINYSTDVDPAAATTLTYAYAGPQERLDHIRLQCTKGGQVTTANAQRPEIRYSFDDGVTYSASYPLPITGVLDLYTYPGGFTPWHTGVRATFSQGTVYSDFHGAARLAGATVDGDVVWTKKSSAAVQVVQVTPTTPTAFGIVVASPTVTITALTTGGTAASYSSFTDALLGVVFATTTVGTGGNAITIATVSDGTDQVTVVGNAVTIHYTDGVTTVTNVKAHFPVATTFGSVTATGGTGANILVAPTDTHGATNLAGGVNAAVQTTGADAVAAVLADANAAALVAGATVGTGLGLIAAGTTATMANGGVRWTGLKPGVRVRQLVAGNSTPESVSVSGLDVTLNLATDSDGAQTSTANSLLATLAASASASALVSGVADGTGAGLAGTWNDFVELLMNVEEGDEWTSYTTPPKFSSAQLSAALTLIQSNFIKTLGNVEFIHIVQDDLDNLSFQGFSNWVNTVKTNKKIPIWGGGHALYRVSQTTTDTAWAAAAVAALPSPRANGGTVSLCAGEVDTAVTLYGCQLALCTATLFFARCMNVIISQAANQTQCPVLTADGTQFALTGIGLHSVAAGADEIQALWEGDDALLELHAQNVATGRTLAEYDGVFIRQTLNFVDDNAADYIFWERRRVMNRAFRGVDRSLAPLLNGNVLTDPRSGTLAESARQQIQARVTGDLNSGVLLNDQGIDHVSAFLFKVSATEKTALTNNVVWSLTILPLAKVITLSGTIGFAVTLTGTANVTGLVVGGQ